MANEIIKVLDALCEKFGLAIDWTSENVMPYITMLQAHMLAYYLWSNILTIVIAIICITFLMLGIKYINKHPSFGVEQWSHKEDKFYRYLAYTMIFICICTAIIVIVSSSFNIVKCITFPELIVFNEVKSLLDTIN